ncbi:MAG: hypothetical protein PHO56_01805 [Patescibacteria group bacterium]|nr:hypothetical protein [Patescibacteria group bacterium]
MNNCEKPFGYNTAEKMKKTPEELRYDLGCLMADIAEGVNKEFGNEKVLNDDASVNMRQWQRKFGGEYSKEDVKSDEDMVRGKKFLFSGLSDLPAGADKDAKVAAWEKRREVSKPALLELATTAIFHKVLGEKFMVVRSATFDDYENGVDNIIINKQTGDVVCAFDEVRENAAANRKIREDEIEERTRTEEKAEKIKRKAKSGGTKIKYGFGLEAGKLIKKQITGVPMFYLSVEAAELDELLEKMDYDSEQPNAAELEVFDKLVASLESQVEMLKQEKIHPDVARNLANFEKSLIEIRETRNKF